MRNIRTIALAAATATLVVSALGAPASAAFGKGDIAVVNGRPGPSLDICIGNVKIKRNLPYGGKYWRSLNMGDKLLRAFIANGKARCGGTKVAQHPFGLVDGGDLTFVVTRKSPDKVVVYDNAAIATLGSVQPIGPLLLTAAFAWRTAADLAAVNIFFKVRVTLPDTPVGPSVNPVWAKGDQVTSESPPGYEWQVRATFPEKTKSIAVARLQEMFGGRRYEWIFVGTTGKNARWVKFSRRAYQLGP